MAKTIEALNASIGRAQAQKMLAVVPRSKCDMASKRCAHTHTYFHICMMMAHNGANGMARAHGARHGTIDT